jgi:hypothetical protein
LKITVTYELEPPLHVEAGVEIVTQHAIITIPAIDRVANKILVAIHDTTTELLPRLTIDPKPGVKANIDISPRVHEKTFLIARSFIASLGVFAFSARVKWFPIEYQWQPDLDGIHQLTHSAVAANRLAPWVDVFELYNAGHENFLAERYADALRYHFMVLESLYGGGKSNPTQLVAEFEKSCCLKVVTRSSIRCPQLYVKGEVDCGEYREWFPREDVHDALFRLVLARGRVSHHNLRSPHKWAVTHQVRFRPEATLAANIAHRLVHRIVRREMWAPEIVEACGGIRDQNR